MLTVNLDKSLVFVIVSCYFLFPFNFVFSRGGQGPLELSGGAKGLLPPLCTPLLPIVMFRGTPCILWPGITPPLEKWNWFSKRIHGSQQGFENDRLPPPIRRLKCPCIQHFLTVFFHIFMIPCFFELYKPLSKNYLNILKSRNLWTYKH